MKGKGRSGREGTPPRKNPGYRPELHAHKRTKSSIFDTITKITGILFHVIVRCYFKIIAHRPAVSLWSGFIYYWCTCNLYCYVQFGFMFLHVMYILFLVECIWADLTEINLID